MIIPTSSDNVAFSIALGVLLLSVVLHPIVRWCFHRIRANVAWKSIEKQRPVEVTKYNIFSEALGDRGRWDMARVVTILLAAFHVSTWGLELSLDLALRTDGPVDLLNRPPPVVFRTQVVDVAHNFSDWIVMRNEEAIVEGGSLDHIRGTLVDGNATSTYRIGETIIRGNTVFASWSPQSSRIASGLFYDIDDGQAIVSEIACSTPSRSGSLYITAEESKWGDVFECESGPSLVNASANDRASPPVILLNSTEGEAYLIVEEESSYPSFLYSVWMPGEVTPQEAQLNHVFYVSSTTRLVEAIVSAIANGIANGGGCLDMLTKFSLQNATYSLNGAMRVSPFGEHPRSSSVESLDQVEPIVAGVLVSDMGTVCGAMLMVVTGAAFAGCLCCYSRKALDVYDRDQLIRAISLPSGEGADGKPAAIKIYVRQEQDNAFSIIISDDGVYRGCAGLKKRLLASMKSDSDVLENSVHSMSGSGVLPLGTRELTFDGVRSSTADSDGPHQHAEQGTHQRRSPVPVPVPTPARTPARTLARRPSVVGLVASPVLGASVGATPRRRLALTLENLEGSSSTTVGTTVEDLSLVASVVPKGERTASSMKARKSMGQDDVEAAAPCGVE